MGKVVLITSVYQWLNKLKAHCRPPAGPVFCPRFSLDAGMALCVSVLPGWLWFGQGESSQVKIGEIWAPSFQQLQEPVSSHHSMVTPSAGPAPSLHISYATDKIGRYICGIPSKTLVNPGGGQNPHADGTAWEGSAPDHGLCMLGFVWSHCEGQSLSWRTRGLAKWDQKWANNRSGCSDGRVGKSLEEDVISTHETDPILSLQLAESCGKEVWRVRKSKWPARAPLISLILWAKPSDPYLRIFYNSFLSSQITSHMDKGY